MQHQHTFGVSSYVLTSETVQNKNDQTSSQENIKILDSRQETLSTTPIKELLKSIQKPTVIPINLEDEDDLIQKMKEVGGKFEEEAWQNYSLCVKQAMKGCL